MMCNMHQHNRDKTSYLACSEGLQAHARLGEYLFE